MQKLKIASIFKTLDGEVNGVGGPLVWSIFVRTAGCNLRCWKSSGFCDAPHSLDINGPHQEMTVDAVVKECVRLWTGSGRPRRAYARADAFRKVTITGGEPLLQREPVLSLVRRLSRLGFKSSLETSGSLHIGVSEAAAFDSIVWDVKTPSTEMSKKNNFEFFQHFTDEDYLKFVIQDYADFYWALAVLDRYPTKARIAFGPRYGLLNPVKLIQWIKESGRLEIQLNLQFHKWLWPECEPVPCESLKDVDHAKLLSQER